MSKKKIVVYTDPKKEIIEDTKGYLNERCTIHVEFDSQQGKSEELYRIVKSIISES